LLKTSADMMDRTFGNNTYPPKWRSSIAVFRYEPPEVPEELQGRKITYFKIACTITGFQSAKLNRRFLDFGDLRPGPVRGLTEHLNRYYACYGALLQVSILPAEVADREDLAKYPIITDFEPKRRDLYELVTDTGEVLSSSSGRAAVNKGFTSNFSTENSWGLTGTAQGGSTAGQSGGGGGSGSLTGSVGGKQTFGTQDATIMQMDYAREKRESQSHVTSLTQMYNLLQSYHLGTNRAVFLVLPRPHTVEQSDKRTFINGPREIEGVQEFFLIVSRPQEVADVCIECHLETGHLDLEPNQSEAAVKDTRSMNFDFKAPRSISHGSSLGDDSTSRSVTMSRSFTPPTGYEIDVDQGQGGYLVVVADGTAAYNVQATVNGVTVTGTVVTTYVDVGWSTDDRYDYQDISGELLIFLRKKSTVTQGEVKNTFFITSRRVAACTNGHAHDESTLPEWVVLEAGVRIDPVLWSPRIAPSTRMRVANALGATVGELMLRGQHSLPRYANGAVDFHQSQFVLERFSRAMRRDKGSDRPLRRPLSEAGLDRAAMALLSIEFGPDDAVETLINAPIAAIVEQSPDTKPEEALALKWKALGLGPRKLP
jgi:hypothetical protein